MDYWAETMVAAAGWKAETHRLIVKDKKTGRERDKGWACDLLPKPLIVVRYYAAQQAALDGLAAVLEAASAALAELEEEHGGEDGAFGDMDKVNKASVSARLKEIGADPQAADEAAALNDWFTHSAAEAELRKRIKAADAALDDLAYNHYPTLTEPEIIALAVDDKWLASLEAAIGGELEAVSQGLTERVKQLAERYASPLPRLSAEAADLEARVSVHLERMGFAWT